MEHFKKKNSFIQNKEISEKKEQFIKNEFKKNNRS